METSTVGGVLLLPAPPSLSKSPLYLGLLLADRSVHTLLDVRETLPKSTRVTLTTIADKQNSVKIYLVVSGGRTHPSACLLATKNAVEVRLGTPTESFASFTKVNVDVCVNEYGVVCVTAAEEVGLGVNYGPTEIVFDIQNPTACRPDTVAHKSNAQLYNPDLVRRLPIKLPYRTIAVSNKVYTVKQQFTGDTPVAQHDLTGCALWESGIIASHLIPRLLTSAYKTLNNETEFCAQSDTHRSITRRRMRVLEIGCGAGLVSTVLADLCPFIDIVATDGEELALSLSAENARRNGVCVVESFECYRHDPVSSTRALESHSGEILEIQPNTGDARREDGNTQACAGWVGRVQFTKLDWNDTQQIKELMQLVGPFDYIVGSDLVYPAAPLGPLLNVLKHCVKRQTTAYIITKNRTGEGDEFIAHLRKASWMKDLLVHSPDSICDDFRKQHDKFRIVSFTGALPEQ